MTLHHLVIRASFAFLLFGSSCSLPRHLAQAVASPEKMPAPLAGPTSGQTTGGLTDPCVELLPQPAPGHPSTAPEPLANVVEKFQVLWKQGKPFPVQALLRESIAQRLNAVGRLDLGLAILLRMLAGSFANQGAVADAENATACSLALLLKLPESNARTEQQIQTLYLQAEIKNERRDLLAAQRSYEEALQRVTALAHPNPVFIAQLEKGLADALGGQSAADPQLTQQMQEKAEQLYRHALSVFIQAGEQSQAANLRISFGLHLLDKALLPPPPRCDYSLYGEALTELEAARLWMEREAELDDAAHIAVLSNLALLRLRQSCPDDALALANKVLAIGERRLRREAPGLPLPRLMALLEKLHKDEENLYSVTAQLNHPGWNRLALATTLLRKSRSLDLQGDRLRLASLQLTPEQSALREELATLHQRYSDLTWSRSSTGEADLALSGDLAKLGQQIDDAEQRLGVQLAPSLLRRQNLLTRNPEEIISRVQRALTEKELLLEIVAYQRRQLWQAERAQSFADNNLSYLAMVLLPSGEIVVRDLDIKDQPLAIKLAVGELRQGLTDIAADPIQAAQRLYELVLRPMEPVLKNVQTLRLSVDGDLSLVPFYALHDGRTFLLDRFEIGYLSSGRDLLHPRSPQEPGESVIIADPDYGLPEDWPWPGCPQEPPKAGAPRSHCSLPFPRLERVGDEAKQVSCKIADAKLLLRGQASKQAFLGIRRPGILLVSTHGKSVDVDGKVIMGDRGGSSRVWTVNMPQVTDPLLRSVLVLSGANRLVRGRSSEGMVTALEALDLDLWGTQLAVLSACETGIGVIHIGQGVDGLQHALSATGAESTVTSLWPVNDDGTHDLMINFFNALQLGAKSQSAGSRGAALRQAAMQVRFKYPHPYYWAPFIIYGALGPLHGIYGPASQPCPALPGG